MENNTRRAFKSRMDAKQDVWRAIPALMGDGNGTIAVPNQENMVYIRVGDGDLGQAFNNRCQLRDNLAIYVGYDPVTDPDRRIFQVLSVRMADYAGAGNVTVPNVGPHHTTHEFGGGDDVYLDWRRLMGLRVGRPAAFVVTVDPGYIYRAGWIAIPSTNVNLTATHAALVGAQAQYVLISLSSVGAVTATAGAVVISPAVLTIADVPVPPAGHIPLAAVRLYKAQTAIGDTPAAPDIIDLRFPTYNSTAASGVAGGADTQVQYNDGGVLNGNALFTFNDATGQIGYDEADWTGGNIIFVPLAGNIQTYINAATAGDTLVLASGEYVITSTITVAKQLNIVGQGNAGFYSIPYAPAHGTVISSATASIVAFQINSSNVRVADMSIHLTGNASTGINTAKDLTGLVLHNIDVIVTCAGLAQGFTVWSSNIVMRNLSFYITSTNTAAYGFWFWNDNTSTINAIADCFNVTGTVLGAGTAAYCFACENINDANTLTLNLESCAVRALNGTPLDIAVAAISTTTSNATVNCYLCTLEGANYDAYQNNANALNLGGSVLVNNLVSGTVTYRAAMAAGLGVFSGLLTAGSGHIGDAATNYAAFATDGELTLTGTARVDRQFIVPLLGFTTGAAKPVETILGNYLGYAFSINDLGYFSFETPADWDTTSDISISIHWYINEAYALQSAEVRWALVWTATKENATEAIDAATTTTNSADVNIPATAKYLTETLIAIPSASLQQHDQIGFQVKRVALVDGTDPTAKPVVVAVECEYIANRLGIAT